MKTRKLNLAIVAVFFVMSISGCASISTPSSLKSDKLLKSGSDSIEVKFGVARMLERNGKLAEARNSYHEILSTQYHSPSLHRLGMIAIRQNRLDEGLKHLAEAVAAGDVTTELLGDYGDAQFLAGERSAAEKKLRKAVPLDPSEERNGDNLVIVIGKQDRFTELFQLFREADPEAVLTNLASIQSQSEDLEEARENFSKALDLDPKLKVAPLKQEPELEIEETRPERQASWNQPAEFSSDSAPQPKQAFDRILATKRLPLMDHDKDIDDVNQQISAIEEEIRVRQENLEKRLESNRRQESARSAAIAKREERAAREELARLQEVNRRLELAELEELATRLKLAEREDIVKRLELAERQDSVNRDEAAKLDPMSSIAKLIEENKRIKKRTSQPAQ